MTAFKVSRSLLIAAFAVGALVSEPWVFVSSTAKAQSTPLFSSGHVKRGYKSHRGFNKNRHSNYNRKHRVNRKYNSVNQRQRFIEKRNRRVTVENYIQAERRSRNVLANPHRSGVYINGYRHGSGYYGTGGDKIIYGNGFSNQCPSGHSCGYRLYENGSGPRIISPGVNSGLSGLNGPVVITLD